MSNNGVAFDESYHQGYNSYIMSAYVKYMEQSGARVVPLIVTDSDDVL